MYIMTPPTNMQVNYPSTTFQLTQNVGGETSYATLNGSVFAISDRNSISDSDKHVSLGVTGLFVSSNTAVTKAVLNQTSLILSNTDGTDERVHLSGDEDNANLTLKDSGGTGIFNTSYVSFGNTSGTKNAEYNLDYAFIKDTSTDKRLNLSTTEISISNAADDTEYLKLTEVGLTASASVFDLHVNSLSFKGVTSDAARQVIMSDATGSPYWDNVTLSDVLTENGDAENGSITNLDSLETNNLGVTGLATFQSLPRIVPNASVGSTGLIPTRGNELVTKGYVDSLVGQYSGGYNLYLNYSQTETVNSVNYGLLSNIVTPAGSTSQQIDFTSLNSNPQLIKTFITKELNVTTIPAGIWSMFLYGAVNNTTNNVQYYFDVKLYTSTGITGIFRSGDSSDINESPNSKPIGYNINGTMPEQTVALSDRIIIEIFCKSDVPQDSVSELKTFFEGQYYSFIQTTLNAGTSLLTSDNNWTANNTFDEAIILKDGLKVNNSGVLTQLNSSGLTSQETAFAMNLNNFKLTLDGLTGTENQVLTTDASGIAHWQDVPSTVTLDEVLEESNDANQRSIVNLSSIEFKTGENHPVVLSQKLSGTLQIHCDDSNKVIDTTRETKQFSGNYIKLAINGTEYWIQAFTELPS
jgi:hypothetical protein